jgi:SAM-dependent methyltransferase
MAAASIAATLGTAERRLRALLDVLVAERLFYGKHDGSSYLYLATAVPSYREDSCGDWDRLAHVISTDTPLPERDETLEDYLSYVDARSSAVAPMVWRSVAPEPGRMLDLGGGLGAFSRAFLGLHPDNTSTVADRSSVVDLAAKMPVTLGSRLEYMACDVRELTVEDCYDLVLLANVLHLYGERSCESLLKRAAAALKSGGTLVIKDFYLESDGSGPLASLYFALNMAVYSESGRVHQVADITRWLGGLALTDIRVMRLSKMPESVVVTAKKD